MTGYVRPVPRLRLPRWTAGRRAVVTALLALALASASAVPLTSGPRPLPPPPTPEAASPFEPALPHVGPDWVSLGYRGPDGSGGVWLLDPERLPVRFRVEREVVDRIGWDRLDAAVQQWNGVPGSRFGAVLDGTVDDAVRGRLRDGVSRIFLDDTACGDRYLARAHLYPAAVQPDRIGEGVDAVWVTEVDIGVCRRLDPGDAPLVLRHELLHVAGLGHLCDPGDDCWQPAMGEANGCRVTFPRARACATPAPGDLDALATLHPVVPRLGVGRGDLEGAVAAASRHLRPRANSAPVVVAAAADSDPVLLAAATVTAEHAGAPLVVLGEDCSSGPGALELNRVAAVAALVHLVGPVSPGCDDQLGAGWGLDLQHHPSATSLVALAERYGADPRRVVAVPAGPELPARSGVAATLAVRRRAVLLPAEQRQVGRELAARLRAGVDQVDVVALTGASTDLTARLRDRHPAVRVRSFTGTDAPALGARVAAAWDVFGLRDLDAVVVSATRPGDLVAAAVVAAAARGVVLPIADGTGPRAERLLVERAGAATVVGPRGAVSDATQLHLSRLLDTGPA